MKNVIIIVVIILGICGIVGSCDDSSSYDEYPEYSNTYNNDYEYRENVGDIAEAFGISEKEVDEKINAITGGR